MPGKIMLVLFLCFTANISLGQVESFVLVKRGKYKVFIKLIQSENGKKKIKGYPLAVTDSGMWLTKGFHQKRDSSGDFNYRLTFIEANNIENLYFRRKSSIGWGILVGAVAGMFIGGGIASASVEQPENSFSDLEVAAGVIIGMEAGAALGGFTGALIRKNFAINGDLQKFLKEKVIMQRYLPRYVR